MKLGTLSTELAGVDMKLSGAERINAIMTALREHSPDILLSAGHSLHDDADLAELGEQLSTLDWDGLLIVEVKDFDGGLPRRVITAGPEFDLSSHCLFAWTRETGWKCMGRQYFTRSDKAREGKTTLIPAFESALADRVVTFRGKRIGALICGEINALQGRNAVQGLSPPIEEWLRSLDIIVNPTHDRMGNGGTLKAKRRWLSINGRVYLSSSNWNSRKPVDGSDTAFQRQSRDAKTLHALFVNGENEPRPMKSHAHETFEYREALI